MKQRYLSLVGAVALAAGAASAGEKLPRPQRKPSAPTEQQYRLVKDGIALHDSGDHDGAIAKFRQVLAENPDEVHALYEMAFTYFTKKDHRNAMALARQGAEFQSPLLPQFCVILGSGLDDTGRREEAVEIFRAAIKRAPGAALLHFNLGVTLYRSGRHVHAKRAVQEALVRDPNHPGSHLLLANIYSETGYRIPAILAFSRFLMLEPLSPRAKQVLPVVEPLLTGGVTKGEKPGHVNVTIALSPNSKRDEGDFDAVQMAMSLAIAGTIIEEVKRDSSPFKLLVATYSVMAELMGPIAKKRRGFAARYFAPFFVEMEQKGHMEAFVCQAWQAARLTGAAEWVKENLVKLGEFRSWASTYRWGEGK